MSDESGLGAAGTSSQSPATSVSAELRAFDKVAEALGPLDISARGRILRWASERFLHNALDALEEHLRESADEGERHA